MSITLKEKAQADIGTPVATKATLFIDSADEKLKKKLSDGSVVTIEVPAASVSSVFGRTGDVVAEANDYSAAEIQNVPAGNIIATNVQTAINELDSEKLSTAHQGAGGSVHALVNGVEAGFMSVSDKSKLDGIEAGANATAFSSGTPQAVGTASAGSSGQASRSDHVHAHGNQAGGLLHSTATTGVDGFMAAADKSKLDGIEAGANLTVSSSALPQAVGIAAPGVSSQVSKSDHVHAHGDQAGGSLHDEVTSSVAGFMPASDKTKLDGIESGATQNQTDAYLLARANHTGTQLAETISDFAAAADYRIEIQKAVANGLATLGPDEKIPASQIPAVAIAQSFVVNSEAQMLALDADPGDIAVRTDITQTFILQASPASTLANWIQLLTPGDDAIHIVNGQYGFSVDLYTSDIPENTNLYYTDTRADDRINLQKGAANGLATLDASSLLPAAQHGSYTDPTDHAVATTSVAGFMSGPDKLKMDGVEAGANATVSSNSAPQAVGIAASGVSSQVSRADHVHAHGDQAGGTLHSTATTIAAGFMSAADKSKLDGIATGATQNQTDAYLLDRANHTGTQGASTIANLTGLSLPAFGQIVSSDTLLVALAKVMSQGSLHPVIIAQNMTIPADHIYRRPQLTKLVGASTKLAIVGNGRLTIRT